MSIVIFVLLRFAPGNIVDILFSTGGYVSESDKAAIMKELGIDRPIWVQYVDWLREILTGDLGKSYRYDLPAWQVIKPLIPVTVELAVLSTLIAIALGVPTGVISAIKQDSMLDYVLRVISLAGLSMPSFWLGMVIILGLVAWVGWIPPISRSTPSSFCSRPSPSVIAPRRSSCASRARPCSRCCAKTTCARPGPRDRLGVS